MSKAFDKISHHSIINALMPITPAINPFIENLIRSFLSGRNHYTQVNGVTSSLLHTNQAVPQGTVGGPHLYNAGSDDVITTNEPRDHAISAFAQDTTPCIAGSQTLFPSSLGTLILSAGIICLQIYQNATKFEFSSTK